MRKTAEKPKDAKVADELNQRRQQLSFDGHEVQAVANKLKAGPVNVTGPQPKIGEVRYLVVAAKVVGAPHNLIGESADNLVRINEFKIELADEISLSTYNKIADNLK